MRTAFVQTKVRPIKKLFILNANDLDSLKVVMKEISAEVDAIYNLILPDDGLLWTEITREFVKRHDPDIILNLSSLNNSNLSKHFEVAAVTPNTDQWKIGRFGTRLSGFSNVPSIAQRFGASIPNQVFAASNLENNSRSIFDTINFGLVENFAGLHLEASIFEKVAIEPIPDLSKVVEFLFDHERKFCHLTTGIGFGSGGGTSIYEKDYNEQKLFNKGKYLFVGRMHDLSSICYFWNTRATYGFSDLAWISLDMAGSLNKAIDAETTFVVTDAATAAELGKMFNSVNIISATHYHFSGAMDRWKCFEHTQVVTITGDSVVIQHPAARSFSDVSMGGACVLEVRGLSECTYPVRESFWKLYRPKRIDPQLFAERFYRISQRGLSHYYLQFFDHGDLEVEVQLPKLPEVVTHLFEAQGLSVHRTSKTAILEQLVNLAGGTQGASKLCQKKWFELISSLTPTVRTKKALHNLLGTASTSTVIEEQIMEIVGRARDEGAIEFPETVMSADDLASKAGVQKEDRSVFYADLQELYDKRILLRGKSFSCTHCSSKVWFPLDTLRRKNYCPECGNETHLPVHQAGQVEKDGFKLNQLIVRAMDQGQMATLLVLNIFSQQNFRIFDFVSNLEVKKNAILKTDVDLFLRFGNKLGIAECKSASGFSDDQVDSLIDIASCMKCDFVVLSSLLSQSSTEIQDAVEYIQAKNLAIPILIFSKEVLFKEKPIKLLSFFESTIRGEFPKGAILVN